MNTTVVLAEVGVPLPVGTGTPAWLQLLAARRSSSATTLTAPAPDAVTLRNLLQLAARVPDHGKLAPWRFIAIEGNPKTQLIEQLENIARTREDSTKASAALNKLRTPPLCVAVISRVAEGRIPVWEQQLSAGAVCMQLLLAAHAAGFGANWITDWYAYDQNATRLLGLREGENVAGYVHIGTPQEIPKERPRADIETLLSYWLPGAA